jgi:hypothetical protein
MPDYRLPLARAREAGLLPDLPAIRKDVNSAALNLYGELIADNPRMPVDGKGSWPIWPACPASDLTEAQRALYGVYLIDEHVPPWEWLSHLLNKASQLPLIVWAGRIANIGKTGEYIEQLVRIAGGDPDVLATLYAANPDVAPGLIAWRPGRIDRVDFEADQIHYASIRWWLSDGPGRADFNQRVFEFALRRLPELIAFDDE